MSRLEQTESGNLIVRTMRQNRATIQELEENPVPAWWNKTILMVRLQHRTEKPPDQNLLSRLRNEQEQDQWIQEIRKAFNETDCQKEVKDFVTNILIIEEQGLSKCQESAHEGMTPIKRTDAILVPKSMTKDILNKIHNHPTRSKTLTRIMFQNHRNGLCGAIW